MRTTTRRGRPGRDGSGPQGGHRIGLGGIPSEALVAELTSRSRASVVMLALRTHEAGDGGDISVLTGARSAVLGMVAQLQHDILVGEYDEDPCEDPWQD